jgi:hypothetical protein
MQFDGSVVPSNLGAGQPADASAYRTASFSLKEGVVTDIIYPDQSDNLSKRDIEYNIAVVEYLPQVGANLQLYRNCRVANLFGTTNNSLNFTLQPSTDKMSNIGDKVGQDVFKDGARVIVLCIGGVSQAGYCVIVGGLRHGDDKVYSSKDGQFHDFNFNGVQQLINKDGEYVVNFNSPIDQDGKQSKPKAAGTQVKIDKEGRVSISDNEGQVVKVDRVAKKVEITNGFETFTMDKANKLISMNSSGDVKETASKSVSVNSGSDTKIDAGGQVSMKSGGQTLIDAGGTMDMKSGGQWRLQASGNVIVTAGGEVSVVGASGPVIKSAGPLTLVGQGAVPAAAVGISQCFGLGNLGAPVLSTIITGSSTVFIGA